MAVEFRLLGPVEVSAAGVAVPLGGAKPQTLLAALLLEHGHIVPTARLIDIIWPDDPPETAKAAIQTYVKTLRQALARHGVADVIVTRAPGYLVQIPAGSLDVDLFDQLLAQAREASTPQETSDLLGAALALWRGPALAGSHTSLLAGEVVRLEQLRLTATQERMAADLALGRHGQLVAELAALVGRHPADERLRGQYMTALYRLGRQSDALASFREGRQVLVEELGVDPGPELTGLYHAILRGDPILLASPSGEAVGVAVPTQLPLAPADFTGRALQTSTLVAALTDPAPAIQVIAGRGGSGKSALAAHVAHQVATAFPDGQLYAELRGLSETPAEAGEVLGLFLRALGVEPAAVPAATAERAELYRRLLAGRRVLVLLDDAADERQVRPLLLGGGGCAVLVTSRNRLGGLAGVRRTDLDVLDPDEAVELLVRIVGADRVSAEEPVAREIAELCGRLPLAIRIAGARLATRQRWPLRLLADRLTDERRRLDELAIADLEVRAGFELSYRALDTGARQALRRLGHLGVPEFASWVVAWLTGTAETAAEDLVERLVDAQLVDFSRVDDLGTPRFRVHDLVRIYGRERAEAEEPAQELAAAVGRVLGGWLTLTDQLAADAPSDEIGRPRPALASSPVSDELAARVLAAPHDWFDIEQPALVVGLERAAALGLHDLVCQFTSARLGPSFLGVNRFESRERINQAALAAARRAGDRYGEATMLAELGHLRYDQDHFPEARRVLDEALGAFRELGDARGQAVALSGLGVICREAGRLVEALHFLDEAGALLGEDAAIAYPRRLAASVRLERGDFPAAWSGLAESLAAYRRAGSHRGEAVTLRTMSLFHRATGEYAPAIETAEAARTIFDRLGDKLMEAYSVRAWAKAQLRLGRTEQALAPLEGVLSTCQAMGDRWGLGVTLRTLGELHLADGHLRDAAACLTAAMEVWQDMDAPLWRARTERDLALLHEARGESGLAAKIMDRAVKVFRDHGAREYGELTGGTAAF
ncbi:BTAD domain-containing putative transcriptional regulator [Acrocarpospora macrocephala]|uniref:SARP family transcriptional regulator n=1 Tax=Acrocarpospora macrocephala TaxID=150177 RepID=A0A5M3X067_9ACTN|nr:AfsR/SARP family transcriptional regulator [Acrocarpospora macrocephala]GES12991.1 SARP family transcriptional regulator [Acrocarpospora macrocephala]